MINPETQETLGTRHKTKTKGKKRKLKKGMTRITSNTMLLIVLSLVRYLWWWTISPTGHHHPSSQYFRTDMAY